jgi:hypothetical protein
MPTTTTTTTKQSLEPVELRSRLKTRLKITSVLTRVYVTICTQGSNSLSRTRHSVTRTHFIQFIEKSL